MRLSTSAQIHSSSNLEKVFFIRNSFISRFGFSVNLVPSTTLIDMKDRSGDVHWASGICCPECHFMKTLTVINNQSLLSSGPVVFHIHRLWISSSSLQRLHIREASES